MAFTDPRTRKPIADDLVGEALADLQDQITNFVPAPLTPANPVADVTEDATGDAEGAIIELQNQLNALLGELRSIGILDT